MSSRAAYGLKIQTTTATRPITSAGASEAPRASLESLTVSAPLIKGRRTRKASAKITAALTSAPIPAAAKGSDPGGAGGDVAFMTPNTPSARMKISASANGKAAATTQTTQRATGERSRRSRAKPSAAARSAGSSSAAASKRIAHGGSSLRVITRSRLGLAVLIFGLESSAVSERSPARPKPCSRVESTGASPAGGNSPLAESRTAGIPAATAGPCWPTVTGQAKRASSLRASGEAAFSPVSARKAVATVRDRTSGAAPGDDDQPVTS